jgi:hypothetical protein
MSVDDEFQANQGVHLRQNIVGGDVSPKSNRMSGLITDRLQSGFDSVPKKLDQVLANIPARSHYASADESSSNGV